MLLCWETLTGKRHIDLYTTDLQQFQTDTNPGSNCASSKFTTTTYTIQQLQTRELTCLSVHIHTMEIPPPNL